jgi:hypothetical protein
MPKVDHRGRNGRHSARPKRRGAIDGPFVPHRKDMLESAAFRALSFPARQVLDRLELEHMNHGGQENGALIVTHDQFEAYGVRRASVSKAIAELENRGFVEVTKRGRGGNADFRAPNTYRLTYLPVGSQPPTDDWRSRGA